MTGRCVKEETEALLRDMQEYRDLSDRVRSMFGDVATLKDVVDSLERKLLEPEKPDPVNARILTYEESAMWDAYRAIGTPEQCWEAVEHTRWIPVSERLPENESECLVTLKKTYGMQEVVYGIANYLNFGDTWHWNEKKYGYLEWDKYSDGYGGTKAYRVIAWMPLPEPYHVAEESNVEEQSK